MKNKVELLEQLRKDLHKLMYNLHNYRNRNTDSDIDETIEKLQSHIDEVSEYLENKEWEIRKIRRHEFYNSLLLVVPTILGLSILIYSVTFLENPQVIGGKPEKVQAIEDSLKQENKLLQSRIRIFQDSVEQFLIPLK